MSNKNIWYIENKNELPQIKNINKAGEEKFDYIAIINPTSLVTKKNKLKEIINNTKIPFIIYSEQTSGHDEKTKEIMHLASYDITGLKDVLLEGGPDKFIDNFNKMINESLDN